MKRFTVVKRLVSYLQENDIIIVTGPGLCKDVFAHDDRRMFYFEDPGMALSFSLGVAITNDKRVFVFCEDSEVLRNYEVFAQIGVSGCRNLFIFVMGCGRYQESGGQPSIFDSLNGPKGSFFNLGLTVFDFTNYFKFKSPNKEIQNVVDRLRGAVVMYIQITPGLIKTKNFNLKFDKMKNRFEEFVQDLELGTSLFVP